jgi:serine/threonine protein kinase
LPEIAICQPAFDSKADIWALGCIAFEILHGYKLFSSDWSVIEAAAKKSLPEIPIDERFEV